MIAPKLRFSEFKSEWFKQKIGDFIINPVGGASFTPNDFVKESNFEVIPKKAIMSGGKLILDKENPTFSSEDFYQNNLKNTIDKSYLVTTLRDLVPSGPSIGYIVSFDDDKKYILAQGVYGFRIKDDLNRNFLIQFSNTSKFRTIMQSKMVGSTQVHIRNQDYFDTEIYKPCLEEQTKIAEFLSAVDDKISQLSRQLELLNQYKKGVMQKIFSQEIRFKNDNGDDFGEWNFVELGEICDLITKGTTPTSIGGNFINEGISFIKIESINENGNFIREKFAFIDESTNKLLNRSILKENDILFSIAGALGRVAIVDSSILPANTNQALAIIRLKNKDFTKFIYYFLNSEKIKKLIENESVQLAQANFSLGQLSKIEIALPSIQEQAKIAEFLTAIDERIDHTTAQLIHTKQWKKGLLQQMFV